MQQIFYKYLLLQKKAGIAGVGTFECKRRPAQHDFVQDVFVAPTYSIDFTQAAIESQDAFLSFVATEEQCSVETAELAWQRYAGEVNESLQANKSLHLPELGNLFLDENGQLIFEPADNKAVYLPDILAARVSRPGLADMILVDNSIQNARHDIEKVAFDKPALIKQHEKYWWVYAAVLAIIGIGAIVYYYLQNGTLLQ